MANKKPKFKSEFCRVAFGEFFKLHPTAKAVLMRSHSMDEHGGYAVVVQGPSRWLCVSSKTLCLGDIKYFQYKLPVFKCREQLVRSLEAGQVSRVELGRKS